MFRLFQIIGVAGMVVILAFFAVSHPTIELEYTRPVSENQKVVREVMIAAPTSTPPEPAEKKTPVKKQVAVKPQKAQPAAAAVSREEPRSNEVRRTENPYVTPPLTPAQVDALARAALVNIFCETSGGPLSSISGSGVIIDPRGVILTNAHVAQYVLLATNPRVNLSCSIRSGSPAQSKWKADILFIPAAWVSEHAADIRTARPKGTGENDYAFLLITETIDSSPLPTTFPYLSPDTREAIAFTSDDVLLAGYAAEFGGGSATRSSLYPLSVFSRIGDLLTFKESSVDIISLGRVALAQSGSSGGAVVNMWGRIVGLISTTSEGATTAERELRAITMSYVRRDLLRKRDITLNELISGDVHSRSARFMLEEAPALSQQIIGNL